MPIDRDAVLSQTHKLGLSESEVRKTYVSWSRGEADREWQCLSVLAEHAPGLAPRPLYREIDAGQPTVVMERLPGRPLGGVPATDPQTTTLGRALRSLWDLPVDVFAQAGIGERTNGPSHLLSGLSDWLTPPADLSGCREPLLVQEAIRAAAAWLAEVEMPEPLLDAFGIADLNPANVLWDGRRCRLVDFEDAGLTNEAFEIADHLEHLATRRANVFDDDALVEAAGVRMIHRPRIETYRHAWSIFWLAMLLPGRRGFSINPAGTTEDQARRVLTFVRSA